MSESSFNERIKFDHDKQIMEVDFSELTFDSSPMVDQFYDELEHGIADSGKDKWYFLVNYRDCRIYELAWIRFAQRGKRLNLTHSLGSVRYAVREDLSETIEASARVEQFDSNLFASRQAAIEAIGRMKSTSAN